MVTELEISKTEPTEPELLKIDPNMSYDDAYKAFCATREAAQAAYFRTDCDDFAELMVLLRKYDAVVEAASEEFLRHAKECLLRLK